MAIHTDHSVEKGAANGLATLDGNTRVPTAQIPLATTGKDTFTFAAEFDNGNSGTAQTINLNTRQKQRTTLTGNCTFTFTAPPGPGNFLLKVIQDATGSRLATWPASVRWAGGVAPTLTTTATAIDIMSFYYDGTNYYGVGAFNFA
jgi:hypothetical protein